MADKKKPEKQPDKSDLVAELMSRRPRLPSWEAWEMTVDQLRAALKED